MIGGEAQLIGWTMKTVMHTSWMITTALIVVAVPSLLGLGRAFPGMSGGQSSAEVVPNYATASPEVGEFVKTITATGTLHATLDVEVGSQLSGQIAKLLVDFNDPVVKGQPLAELDQSTFRARVNESRAALESAKAEEKVVQARLDRANIDVRSAILQKAVMARRVEIAGIHFRTAEREAQRKATLSARGAAPEAEVIDSTARRDTAAAALREAEIHFAEGEAMTDGAQSDVNRAAAELDSARAAVARAEAELQSAMVDLNRTWIRSPIDGVVVGRSVTEGQTVASSLEAHTLFTLAGDLRHMEVYAHVDESDIGKIAVGESATFTVDAFPDRTFTATVKQVRKEPQVLQNVVTYTVILSSANPDNILLPGMTALAKIFVSRTKNALKVPLAALRFNPGRTNAAASVPVGEGKVPIWVVGADGRPKRVPVVIGEDNGDQITVRSGDLHQDDRVIIGTLEKPKPTGIFGLRAGL